MDVEIAQAAAAAPAAATEQPTVPASRGGDADMDAALAAFRSAMGAPEAPAASESPAKVEPVVTKPAEPVTPPEAPQAPEKANSDLTAILARMQRFEDERTAAQSTIAELQAKLSEREKALEVKDPIAFLKERGFSKEQVEDWLLNGGKSVVAQKSEMEQLKERLERFERQDTERTQATAAEQAEAKRAANERYYRDNVIGKALDATKYPLLHLAHTPADIVSMAYQQAVSHFQRTKGQEPDIHSLLGGMEKTLSDLRDKLSPKAAPRASAHALSELASHSQAGTGGTEAEDDASAFAAASALAKQMLATK